MLRKAGVPLDQIANFQVAVFIPAFLYFLWAPVVDVGLRRRTWLVIAAAISACLLLCAALQPLPANLGYFTLLLSLGNAFSLLIISATGGLVAETVPPELFGRAAGWLQAGNLGGAAVFGAIALSLSEQLSLGWVGLIAASLWYAG